jgi:membrane fusion protein (multidrug efflux system)
LALLLPNLLLFGCEDGKKAAAPAKVTVVAAHTVKTPLGKSFNGVLAAKKTVEVRARVSGYLAERRFEEGAQVTEGQVLYLLDDRDLKAALDTAKANTDKAKAAWQKADTDKNRMVTLANEGAVSLRQRDSAVAAADETLATYHAAQSDEEKAAINLGYATITAPTTGYISRSNVEVGSSIDIGNTLLATVYNIDPIRAEFAVTDAEYAQFTQALATKNPDVPLTFQLELGDKHVLYPHTGALEMSDPIINSQTNTVGVRVDFPNPDHQLRPGLYANIMAQLGEHEVIVIPEKAVLDQDTTKIVYTVNEQNTLAATPVTVGGLIGPNRIIASGLAAGQIVVVEGLVTARPGLIVEAIPATETQAR